ncbi:MAG: hypothetical protein AAF619_11410 [Pseudomonadota bacterium]
MQSNASPDRIFGVFGDRVSALEAASDVGIVITAILNEHDYPSNALFGATVTTAWLGVGDPPTHDESALDLIFRMRETDVSSAYYELIIRDENGFPFYGGWLASDAVSLEISDEIVNGYRVVLGRTASNDLIRHEFDMVVGYVPVSDATSPADAASWRWKSRLRQ